MSQPKYTIEKIKFATDPPTFKKAVALFENGKVLDLKDNEFSYSAFVQGTKLYRVTIEKRSFGYGTCECYLGQQDILCKHIVAVSLWAVTGGTQLSPEDKDEICVVLVCSGQRGELTKTQISEFQKKVSAALRYIKEYDGPSKYWFAYQNSLTEGCARLSAIISELPVSEQTAMLCINLLIRLDDKISRGVDDSDGTVSDFMESVADVLISFYLLDPQCAEAFKKLNGREALFDWEKPLLACVSKKAK